MVERGRAANDSLRGSLELVLGETPELWMGLVSLWLWLVLWRLPVAALTELAQGGSWRWPLGAALGSAAAAAWCYRLTNTPFFYGIESWGSNLIAAGLLTGLLLAWPQRRPPSPGRASLLRWRLQLWPVLPLLMMAGLVGYFWWATRISADPPLVSQILQQSERRRRNRTALVDVLLPPADWALLDSMLGPGGDGGASKELLQRIRPQIDRGRVGYPGDIGGQLARSAMTAQRGSKLKAAIDDYVRALSCENVEAAVGGLTRFLTHHPMPSPTCQRILKALDLQPTSKNRLLNQLDDSFAEASRPCAGPLSSSPSHWVDQRYQEYTRYLFVKLYLKRRHEVEVDDHWNLPTVPANASRLASQLDEWEIAYRTHFSEIEALRALLALEIYRNGAGHYPRRLEEATRSMKPPPFDYLSWDGKFDYQRVGQGRRLESRLARRWADRMSKPVYAP